MGPRSGPRTESQRYAPSGSRADPAEPLHHHRNFPVGPALDEPLEPPELDDVQANLLHLALVVEQDGDLAVALDPRDGLDHDATKAFGVLGGIEGWRRHGISVARLSRTG